MVTKQSIIAFYRAALEQVQAVYLERPSAHNWKATVRSMLVYQQAVALSDAQWAELLPTLLNNTLAGIDEVIVKKGTGNTIDDVLRDGV